MSQQVEMREKQLNIRLSAEEEARLDRVAKHYGLNAAGVIRMLVKREDDAIAREREQDSRGRERRADAEAALKELGEQHKQTPWHKPKKR